MTDVIDRMVKNLEGHLRPFPSWMMIELGIFTLTNIEGCFLYVCGVGGCTCMGACVFYYCVNFTANDACMCIHVHSARAKHVTRVTVVCPCICVCVCLSVRPKSQECQVQNF